MREALTYNDVLLTPQYSDIRSRSEVDISNHLGDIKLDIPIIASPMDTISESHMGSTMWVRGGIAIVHRYNSIQEQSDIVSDIAGAGQRSSVSRKRCNDTLCRCSAWSSYSDEGGAACSASNLWK